MAYKGEENKNQYLAFFEENPLGTYEFIIVSQCTDILYGGRFVTNAGPNRGFEISKEYVIDADKILEDLKETKKQEETFSSLKEPLYTSGSNKPRYIALILGEDIKREVYAKLRERIGGRPNDAQVAEEFAIYAYKIGQCIKEISFDKRNYKITFNRDLTLDTVPEVDRDVVNRQVFKDKTSKQEATVTERKTGNNTVPNNTTTQTTTNITKSSMAVDQKEKSVQLDANQIIERVKKKIKGQDKALEDVVSALVLNQEIIGSNIENADQWKTNILIDGPSGSGKTYIIESVAEELGLPCCVTGITNYSGTGYKGASLSDILARLLKAANGDLKLAQIGVVALDEFDKLSNNEQDSGNSNAMHQSVQDELLTYMSGTKIDVEYNGMIYDFDTTNLSFIAMGAFEKMHKRKIAINEQKISESNDTADGVSREYEVTKDDYIAEGLRRELLGRFQTLTHTNELGIEELKDILLNSTNSRLKKIELIEKLRHKTIEITDEAIDYIVQDAFKNNTGARALGDSIENIISFLNRDINDSSVTEIIITPEIVEKALKSQMIQYIDPDIRRKKLEGR